MGLTVGNVGTSAATVARSSALYRWVISAVLTGEGEGITTVLVGGTAGVAALKGVPQAVSRLRTHNILTFPSHSLNLSRAAHEFILPPHLLLNTIDGDPITRMCFVRLGVKSPDRKVYYLC
jgi:hypothetical protein